MKIEKIHVNKIKVTFTREDLSEHNITVQSVRDNAPSVQKLLMSVVKQAEEEMDFYAEGARLMVEAMPIDGDCMVMYITKLDSADDLKDVMNSVKRRIRLKVKQPLLTEQYCLITFESFDDALHLAAFAKDVDGGELYFYKQRYHLIIESSLAFRFSEFGKAQEGSLAPIVSEHGKLVMKDALKTLREYF